MTIPRRVSEGLVCYYCDQPDWKCIRTNCNEDEEDEDADDEEEEEDDA